MHFIFVDSVTEWTQQILRGVCCIPHLVYTNIGCTNSEFYQDVSKLFVTDVKYGSKEIEVFNILYILNLVLLLMCLCQF